MTRFLYLLFLAPLLVTFFVSTSSAGTTSPSLLPGMPEEIRPITEVSMDKEQYLNLAHQWQQYSQDHPTSAVAQIMIYKALFYSGEQNSDILQAFLSKALELDPHCPEALNSAMRTSLRNGDPMGTMEECYQFGIQAVAGAPDWATPHAMLYILATNLGRQAEAQQHLVAMLEKDYFTPALLDYGFNMLASAAPGGIIITNGDNDTYPCLCLQAGRGIRPDVTIANLSLMTLHPIAKQFLTTASAGFPPALTVQELGSIEQKFHDNRSAYHYMLGNALVENLCEQTSSGKLQRPFYLAVTLQSNATLTCGSSLVLEGVLQRVTAPAINEPSEPITDIAKTFHLFSHELRLDSATGLGTDWKRHPSHVQLMKNYTNILFRMGYDAAGKKDWSIMEYGFEKSLKMASFHEDQATVKLILEYWEKIAPESQNLQPWLARTP